MGSEQVMLPGLASAKHRSSPADGAASAQEEGERAGKPRFEPIDREQLFWRMVNVERLIGYEGKEERHMQVSYRYRAQRSDCQGCPVRSQCCPGNGVTGRSIHRSEELAEVAEFRHRM
jgi:hypothetical protein